MTLRAETLEIAGNGSGPLIGVLALQGDFREHAAILGALGAQVRLVRRAEDLAGISGIVLPGGESSAIDKLARSFGLFEPLREALHAGLAAYGTCAGLIMLADTILDAAPGQQSLGALNVVVRRNAFGAQNQSFETELQIPELGIEPVHATFIRGPIVESVGPNVSVLSQLPDGRVVAVQQDRILATSFHPEMNGEYRFHEYFLTEVISATRVNSD